MNLNPSTAFLLVNVCGAQPSPSFLVEAEKAKPRLGMLGGGGCLIASVSSQEEEREGDETDEAQAADHTAYYGACVVARR